MHVIEKQELNRKIEKTNETLKVIGNGNFVDGLRVLKVVAAMRKAGYGDRMAYAEMVETAKEVLAKAAANNPDDLEVFVDLMWAVSHGFMK